MLRKRKNKKLRMFNFNKKTIYLIVILVSLVIIFLLLYSFVFSKTKNSSDNQDLDNKQVIDNKVDQKDNSDKSNKNLTRRLIDGVLVEEANKDSQAIAVMINNHVEARPTIALAQANFVIEAEVEGGITRYMAIYADGTEINEIGSVRSARPYFIEWAQEFGALYVHCGGSPDALVKIIQEGVNNMNEFYAGSYFWRDNDRVAPHNVLTSSEKIKNYIEDKKFKKSDYFSWEYKDDLELDKRPLNSEIEIKYHSKDFYVKWKYDKTNNEYLRYLGGELHTDKDGEIVSAKNVIIQYIKAQVLDDKLRLDMETKGSGKAKVCFDGVCQDAIWKKNSKKTRTRFYKGDEEFKFNAGTTWVEVVRPEKEVNISS